MNFNLDTVPPVRKTEPAQRTKASPAWVQQSDIPIAEFSALGGLMSFCAREPAGLHVQLLQTKYLCTNNLLSKIMCIAEMDSELHCWTFVLKSRIFGL